MLLRDPHRGHILVTRGHNVGRVVDVDLTFLRTTDQVAHTTGVCAPNHFAVPEIEFVLRKVSIACLMPQTVDLFIFVNLYKFCIHSYKVF